MLPGCNLSGGVGPPPGILEEDFLGAVISKPKVIAE